MSIGLSILSGAHNTIAPRLMALLHERQLDDVLVVIGGIIPDADIPKLEALGVRVCFSQERRCRRLSISSISTSVPPMSDRVTHSCSPTTARRSAGSSSSPSPTKTSMWSPSAMAIAPLTHWDGRRPTSCWRTSACRAATAMRWHGTSRARPVSLTFPVLLLTGAFEPDRSGARQRSRVGWNAREAVRAAGRGAPGQGIVVGAGRAHCIRSDGAGGAVASRATVRRCDAAGRLLCFAGPGAVGARPGNTRAPSGRPTRTTSGHWSSSRSRARIEASRRPSCPRIRCWLARSRRFWRPSSRARCRIRLSSGCRKRRPRPCPK